MELKGKEYLVLYLTDWQKRMIKDFLGVDCDRWEVKLGPDAAVRYGVFPPSDPKVKRMYFADWQRREIRDEAGVDCDFIELDEESASPRILYKSPTRD